MERMRCTGCGKEFDVYTGCSCCGPPSPGPFRCPSCGKNLERAGPAYYVCGDWEEE